MYLSNTAAPRRDLAERCTERGRCVEARAYQVRAVAKSGGDRSIPGGSGCIGVTHTLGARGGRSCSFAFKMASIGTEEGPKAPAAKLFRVVPVS